MSRFDLRIGKAYKEGVGRALVVFRDNMQADCTAALTIGLGDAGIIQPHSRRFEDAGSYLFIKVGRKVKDAALQHVIKTLMDEGMHLEAPEFEDVNGHHVSLCNPYTSEEMRLRETWEPVVTPDNINEMATCILPLPVPKNVRRHRDIIWFQSGPETGMVNSVLLAENDETAKGLEEYLLIRRHPAVLCGVHKEKVKAYAITHSSYGPFIAQGGLFINNKPELIGATLAEKCRDYVQYRRLELNKRQFMGEPTVVGDFAEIIKEKT